MPEEGVELENQATGTYFSSLNGKYIDVVSNIVKTIIMPVPNLLLTPKEINKNVTEAEMVIFIHELRNTGNSTIYPFVSWGNKSDDDFDLLSLDAYLDVNNNGIVDFTDLQISSNNTLEIKSNEMKQIIVKGYVPSDLNQQNTIANVYLTAEIPIDNIKEEAIDTAKYLSGPFIEVTSFADVLTINRGQIGQFSFLAKNIGTYKASPTEIYLDGVLSNKLYIQSSIPLNSIFEGFQYTLNNQFYHLSGESAYSFHKGPPRDEDKARIDSVIFTYDQMEVDEELKSGYFVKSNLNSYEKLESSFNVNYKSAGLLESVNSLPVDILIIDNFNATIDFMNNDFNEYILTSNQSNLVGLELNAGICNSDAEIKDKIRLTLTTDKLKDSENQLELIETEINSGLFYLSDISIISSVGDYFAIGDNILSVKNNDKIIAQVKCNETYLDDILYIDPISSVINSDTNKPISNIRVILEKIITAPVFASSTVGGSNNSPQNVNKIPVFNGSLYETVTDENGQFKLPMLSKGDYKITVDTNDTSYIFPSTKKISELIVENRNFEESKSFGHVFSVANNETIIGIDLPVDNTEIPGLFVKKSISDDIVEIGDVIEYKVEIYNNTGANLVNVRIKDMLPIGIKLIKDSVLLNDKFIDVELKNNEMLYVIDKLPTGSNYKLVYKTQILLSSMHGDKTNTVMAKTGNIKSNLSKVKFSIKDKIFNDNGLLIGKVFMDCNKNRVQEKEEIGIPNVRLFLDTGHFVETDVEGKYHFDNLNSRTYSLVVDKSTLPRGHIFHKTKSRNNNDPYGMFIDIKGGDLFKANFTEGLCSPKFKKLVDERRNKLLGLSDKHGNRKYDDSSKVKNYLDINREQNIENQDNSVFESDINISNNDDFILKETVVDINEVVKTLDNTLGFVNLENDDIIPLQQLSVQIKGKIGSQFNLKLNGDIIPTSRVGQKYIIKSKKLVVWEYIAVKFKAGKNTLKIEQIDPFGNVRGDKEINIIVPGDRAKIQIIVPTEKQKADGFSETKIKIKVVDKNNNKITSKTPITLTSKYGDWDIKDLNENEIGIQTFIRRGEETFKLISPLNINEDIINASSGVVTAQANVKFKPNLKELMVSGIISLQEGDYIDEIEEGDNNHLSLFVQGRIKGDILLTLNYDNKYDKKLLNNINPDSFYEIYGDASKLGFEGETYKKLYLKLENEIGYFLYGNFTPRFSNNDMKIINYQKTLPGVDIGANLTDHLKLRTFIGVNGDKTESKELKSKGVSGPYNLLPDLNENLYWDIYVIEKDTNGDIISKEEQTLYQDYIIDELNNSIYFNRSINKFNGDNEIYVMSEYYEIDGLNPLFTKGVTAEYIKNDLWINTSYISEGETSNELIGVFLKKKMNKSQVELEYGLLQHPDNKDGNAARLKYKLDLKDHKLKIELRNVDENYINKYSNVKSGSSSATIESYHALNKDLKYKQNLEYQKEESVDTSALGYSGGFHKTISPTVNTEIGIKYIKRSEVDSINELNIFSNKWNYNPNWLAKSQWSLLYDVDVNTNDQLLEIDAEYYLREKSKIYLKHKFINDLDSSVGLNSNIKTALGISYEHSKKGNVYSELRLRDAESGEELTTTFGFNQGVDFTKNIKLNFGYEREDDWDGNNDSNSLFSGLEYKTDDNDIYNIKLEYSSTQTEKIYGINLSLINRVNKNVSLYNKFKYEYIENNTQNNYNRLKFESNYIFRPIDSDKLNWMFGYEYLSDNQFEKNETHYLKTYMNYEITTNVELLSHVGYKSRPLYNYTGTWTTNRLLYQVTEKIDAGLRLSTLTDESSQYLYGVEVGYQLWSNIWISGGYNFKEIKDPYYNDNKVDLNQGYYAKLRIKLDDGLFFWIK